MNLQTTLGLKLPRSQAKKVSKWDEIKADALAGMAYLDEKQGDFSGNWKECYALHACQFRDTDSDSVFPHNWFVLAKNMVGKDPILFRSRFIVNPVILEAPEKIEKMVPVKELVKGDDGEVKMGFKKEKQTLNNVISMGEACMSFPQRTKKNVNRMYRIKVRYQMPRTALGITFLYTKTEWIEGIRAHIFQHEVDHAQGKNIYHAE